MLENSATIASLQILANDVLDLREELETSGSEDAPRKKRREEGSGFGGTLLSGNPVAALEQPVLAPEAIVQDPAEKPCPVCTFSNSFESVACTVCDTFFA